MPIMRLEGREGSVRLEPGKKYFWKVAESERRYSQKGDEQISLVLRVGDKAGQARVFETLTFSENAYFRVEQFLKSAGKYAGDGTEVYFDENDVVELSGWCTIRYEHNEQKNRDYARIDAWLEANEQRPDRRWIERATINNQPAQAQSDTSRTYADDIPF